MSLEEREGTLDRVTEKGILLGGDRLSYSKWFEGERPTEDLLGCKIRVVVDAGEKCTFVKKVIQIGEKAPGWKLPENQDKSFQGGPGRRMSPEELELKREEGKRIARSVAIDRAISMVEKGITIEKIADLAFAVEAYLLKGELPEDVQAALPEVPAEHRTELSPGASPAKAVQEAIPAPKPPKKNEIPAAKALPKRLAPQSVNALFNEAVRGGLVKDWQGYVVYVQGVLKVQGKTPYQMSALEFAQVESLVRSRLGRSSAA
jgi:hypothetical protein